MRMRRGDLWVLCLWLLLALVATLAVVLGTAGESRSQSRIPPKPELAVAMVKSHGASAVAIYSTQQTGTYYLGCAHMFETARDRRRQLNLFGYVQPFAPRVITQPRVLAVDRRLDLSLFWLPNGPFYYVRPAARPAGGPAWSIGYDEMSWPATKRPATVLYQGYSVTFTRERPVPGRSGGALVEQGSNRLIGIVQGYETVGKRRGWYISHSAIVRFLSQHMPSLAPGKTAPSAGEHIAAPPVRQEC